MMAKFADSVKFCVCVESKIYELNEMRYDYSSFCIHSNCNCVVVF